MTAGLLAAGATSGPGRGTRFWIVDVDRRVSWIGDGAPITLPTPVPGDSPVVLVDPWWNCPLALCGDGSVARCATQLNARPWISERNIFSGGSVSKKGEVIVLAGCERREGGSWQMWAVTDTRRLIVSGENFSARGIGTVIPTAEKVLAVRLAGNGAEVLLADGGVLVWTSRGWAGGGNVLVAKGVDDLVKIRATRSFCYAPGKDCAVGDVLELSAAAAREMIARGRATAVEADEDGAA